MNGLDCLKLINFLGTHFEVLLGRYGVAFIPDGFKKTGWTPKMINKMVEEAETLGYVEKKLYYNIPLGEKRPQYYPALLLTTKGIELFNEVTRNP